MRRGVLVIAAASVFAWPACTERRVEPKPGPLSKAYDAEADWNNPDHLIPLNYQQAQGKRIFFQKCVWCHAEATPAGPSNRSNLTPAPPLINDGATFNTLSDEFLHNVITLGGSAMGKSAIMPAWGKTLTQDEIRSAISFIRAVAEPPYQKPARTPPQVPTR